MANSTEHIFLIFGTIMLLTSCSQKVYPVYERSNRPMLLADFGEYQSTSVIEVPVTIPLAFLEEALDSIIPDRYEEDDRIVECLDVHLVDLDFRDCRVDGGMNIGKLSFQPHDTGFIATVPIAGVMTYKWKWKSVVTLRSWKEESKDLFFKGGVDLILNPQVETGLQLNPNFDVRFHFDEAYFFFGTKINVRSYLSKYLNRAVKSWMNDYVEENKDRFQLTNYINPVLSQLSKPISLSEEHHVWLQIKPQRLYYKDLLLTDSALIFGLGLETRLTTIWGDPPDSIEIDSIREIRMEESLISKFALKIPLLITYDKLTQVINENYGGNEYDISSDLKIHASNIQLLGIDDKIVIKFNFDAKFKNEKASGWLYFNCDPFYDKQNGDFYLKNIDFDIHTRNMLFKVSKWLYNKRINQNMEKETIFHLAGYIENSKEIMVNMINNKYWEERINLSGNIDLFEVNNVVIRPEGILLIVNMSGILEASLTDFINYSDQ